MKTCERASVPEWFKLGPWLALPRENLLRNAELDVSIEPKQMDVLLLLAKRANQVVATETLLQELWGGTFYGDAPVHRCLAMLRRALGDDSRHATFIRTVRKRGYQLIAPVRFPDLAPHHAAPQLMRNPYPGLRAFTSAECGLFFGRERLLARLLNTVEQQLAQRSALLLLCGASGSGKSSLLQAGLLPRLRTIDSSLQLLAEHYWDLPSNPQYDLDAALCDAIAALEFDGRPIMLKTESSLEPEVWGERLETRLRALAAPRGCFALCLDHAERLVDDMLDSAVRERFERRLLALSHSGVCVLALAVRSDRYHQLAERFPRLMEAKGALGHIDVAAPIPEELGEMIRAPARAFGLAFGRDQSGARLDDVVRDAAVAHPECLPLLQFVLHALAARAEGGELSSHDYADMGGLEGAIINTAERCLSESVIAEPLFDSLLAQLVEVEPETQTLSSRLVAIEQLPADLMELIDRLRSARLLTSHLAGSVPVLKFAHDALLRAWPRVQRWRLAMQQQLAIAARVRQASRDWHAHDRRLALLWIDRPSLELAMPLLQANQGLLTEPEQGFLQASHERARQLRRRRLAAMSGLGLLTTIALLLSVVSWRYSEVARERRQAADQLSDFMLSDIAGSLKSVGRLDLLKSVSQQALTYYQTRARDRAQPASIVQRASAERLLAESLIQQGRQLDGRALLEAADRSLAALDATTPGLQNERAQVAFWLGYVAFEARDLPVAEQAWRSYQRHARWLRDRSLPDLATSVLELSYAHNNLGTLYAAQSQLSDAEREFARSLELKQSLLAQQAGTQSLHFEIADTVSWLARLKEQQLLIVDAHAMYRSQQDWIERALQSAPSDADARFRLAQSLIHQARLSAWLGEQAAANTSLDAARALLDALAQHDPSNLSWRFEWLHARLKQIERTSDAPAAEAQSQHSRLLEDWQAVAAKMQDLPIRWLRLGLNIRMLGDVEAQRTALEGFQQLLARAPEPINALAQQAALARYLESTSSLTDSSLILPSSSPVFTESIAGLETGIKLAVMRHDTAGARKLAEQLLCVGYRGTTLKQWLTHHHALDLFPARSIQPGVCDAKHHQH